MVITVTCPSCSSSFPVDPAKIPEGGVNARCTQCSDVFRIEKPVEVVPEPALDPPVVAAPVEEAPAAIEPPPAVEAAPAVIDSPDDWVMENEEVETVIPPPSEPEVATPEPAPAVSEPGDPFAEAAPFEQAEASAEPVAEAPAAEVAPSGFSFGKRDPTDKAKRLARVLVSDMIMYNAERHQSALEAGTLVPDFEEEIQKSWKEYVEQVGDEMANGEGRQFWTAALNDILAKGQDIF